MHLKITHPAKTGATSPIPRVGSGLPRSAAPGFLGSRPALGMGLLLLGLLIFGLLAVNVRANGPLLAWDRPIDQALHLRATHDSWLAFDAMTFSGALGQVISASIATLLGLYWLWKRYWREFSMLLIGVGGGSLWFVVLSTLFGRHRPVFTDPLGTPLPGPGFPSGHSMSSMLFYGLILVLLLPRLASWRWRLLAALDAALIILLVGYSRLYMGDHYPTDVLGGYAFGLAWGALVYTGIQLIWQRRSAARQG
jgi:membrane-associated phospholipid phosphatase